MGRLRPSKVEWFAQVCRRVSTVQCIPWWHCLRSKLPRWSIFSESTSWRPKRVDSIIPVQFWNPENQESWWHSSNPKVNRVKTKDSQCFSSSPKTENKQISQFKGSQASKIPLSWGESAYLFHSGLQLVGWGPPRIGRAICFTHSADRSDQGK